MKNTPVKNEGQFAEQKIREILNDESVKLYRVDGYEATQSYLVINREEKQFDIYSVTFKKIDSENDESKVKVLDEVYQTDTIPYENLHSAEVDKFVMVAHFIFDDGKVIKITNLSDNTKRFAIDLNELGITTNLLERKWYNKILGFRTKKKWKMVIATFAYLMLIAIVVGMFTGGEESVQEEVVASEESTEESTEEPTADEKERQEAEEQKKLEEEKAEQEAREKEEAEKKAAEEKKAEEKAQKEQEEKERKEAEAKKPENQIAKIIHEEISEDDISEMIIEEYEDGYFVNVVYKGASGWSNKGTVDGAEADMADIVVALSKTEITFRAVDFNAQYTFVDSYGAESVNNGVQTSFNGETIKKIQFEEGYEMVSNIEKLADTYFVHPGLRR